ncbi:regulator of G-protein signaling 13-like [Prinia subflava]|uniref:regulator of G-protein signaling 13-like n=1 Tax=Prinia subflava TaxID=208062 RepID=UPI002FE2760E
MIYKTYLKIEHIDENIEFWLACEAYKKVTSQRKRISMARKLFTSYIQPQAPNEINIDSPARKAIMRNIQEPTQSCFDEAQRIIYRLDMHSLPKGPLKGLLRYWLIETPFPPCRKDIIQKEEKTQPQRILKEITEGLTNTSLWHEIFSVYFTDHDSTNPYSWWAY